MQTEATQARSGYISTADGVRLYYEIVGDGPQAVVIPNGKYFQKEFERFAAGRTLLFYDLRNRGMSDAVSDPAKLKAGIHNDVEGLETVRQHFGISELVLLGHSYVGLMIILYAMKYGAHVRRIVLLGPAAPDALKQYPAHLTVNDGVLQEVFAQVGELQKERASHSPVEFCKKFWAVFNRIYVADAKDAGKMDWGRCELANERNMMRYWSEFIFPSMQALKLSEADFAKVAAPVLIVHGRRDRSAPYGGAREWALRLPDARLVSLKNVAHALWIEEPEGVFGAVETFLRGAWPEQAEKVQALEPA